MAKKKTLFQGLFLINILWLLDTVAKGIDGIF